MLGLLVLDAVIYFIHGIRQLERSRSEIQSGLWFYFACTFVLAYAAPSRFGGANLIPAPWDQVLVALLSLGFYYWGVASRKTLSAEHREIEDDSGESVFEPTDQSM